MKKGRSFTINSRLDKYVLMAFYGVKERRAQEYMNRIAEENPRRRSRVFFVSDLARYEGYETEEEIRELLGILEYQYERV